MKLVLKKINLKEETESKIESNTYDINEFIEYIKTNIEKANFLIENKILDLDEIELYNRLKEVFEIKFENQDYLEILSEKYGKHYIDITTIKTNMIDEDGNNITYIGAKTKKIPNYNGRITLSEIRNITNSYDFLILKTQKNKLTTELKQKEKYENHQFIDINQNFDEKNELFEYAVSLLKKQIKLKSELKNILNQLETYVNEIIYQAKCITKLSEEENQNLKKIGKEYKKAFEENFNKKQITQKNNHKRRY